MDDLISRQAAIELLLSGKVDEDDSLLDSPTECNSFLDWAADEVSKMPSAPRWIPVTERLPKEMGDYLVCDNCQNIYVNEWITTTTTWSWHYDDGRITAWMPLPEPWKGESDGERKDSDFPS